MKPIQTAFRIAQAGACLANEWRDTLYYGVVLPGFNLYLASSGADAVSYLGWNTSLISARELGRQFAWLRGSQPRMVDDRSKPVDKYRNSYAACITSFTIGSLACVNSHVLDINFSDYALLMPTIDTSDAQQIYDTIKPVVIGTGVALSAVVMGGVYACLRRRGGFVRTIPDLYLDAKTGMFDWPRKNKEPGSTQTEKFINWLYPPSLIPAPR